MICCVAHYAHYILLDVIRLLTGVWVLRFRANDIPYRMYSLIGRVVFFQVDSSHCGCGAWRVEWVNRVILLLQTSSGTSVIREIISAFTDKI